MQLQPEGILSGVTPHSPNRPPFNQQGMNPNQQGMNPNQPPPNQQGGDPRVEAARSIAGNDPDLDPETEHKIEMRRIKTLLDAADRELQMAMAPTEQPVQIAPRIEQEVRGRLQGGTPELLSQLMPGLNQQMQQGRGGPPAGLQGIGGLPQGGQGGQGGPPAGLPQGLGQLLASLGGGRGGPPAGPQGRGLPQRGRGGPPVGGLPQLPSNLGGPRMAMGAQGGIVGYAKGDRVGAGSRGPIPALMEKYGSKMVTDFLEGEKQLREEGKHVAPEYADAYEQKKENFYSRFSRTFIQDVYETRGGPIDISEELQLAGGGPIKSYQSVGDVVGEDDPDAFIGDTSYDEELEQLVPVEKPQFESMLFDKATGRRDFDPDDRVRDLVDYDPMGPIDPSSERGLQLIKDLDRKRRKYGDRTFREALDDLIGWRSAPGTTTLESTLEFLGNIGSRKKFMEENPHLIETIKGIKEHRENILRLREQRGETSNAGGGPIKSYQSVGDVVGEMSTTGIDPMSDEELELKRQLTALSGSAQGTAMETEAAIEDRVEAERVRAAGYLGMTPGEITARKSIIDAERTYQPAQTAYRRAERAYHEDIASDEETRLREREMLYGILTTPGGVTEMARKSARVRPRFREDRRRATRNVAGSVRDVAGAVRDETVVPAGLDVALASDIRSIQTAIYGEGAEARDTYYTARNQALQSASQLIIGATGREQGERFAAFDAKMKQLDAQLTHEIHLAEMGQADLANLQSMLNVLMQNDTAIDNQYIEITFDQLSNQEVRAAALQWRQLMLDKNSAQKTEVIRLMELMRSGSGRDGGDPTNDLQRILNERITPPDPPVPSPPA